MRIDLFTFAGILLLLFIFIASLLSVWHDTSNADRFEVISHSEEKLLIFDKKTGDYRTEDLKIHKSE